MKASRGVWDTDLSDRIVPFSVVEARKRLGELSFSGPTNKSVKAFLSEVCEASSTVPSITEADDRDVALIHWISGPVSIEVEVGSDGPRYFWARSAEGEEVSLEGREARSGIEILTKRNLQALSQRISKLNPNWRIQYMNR